jgi:hypothetical protein
MTMSAIIAAIFELFMDKVVKHQSKQATLQTILLAACLIWLYRVDQHVSAIDSALFYKFNINVQRHSEESKRKEPSTYAIAPRAEVEIRKEQEP